MDSVSCGNIETAGDRRGWFIGHFIDDDAVRQANSVEVKWGIHPPGDSNVRYAANKSATTLSILIRGKFRLSFSEGNRVEEVFLKNEGDYAVWLPGVYHNWIAEGEADTVILTVRWPSIAGDQVELQQ